jgi:hypothetical protein
LLVGGLVAEWFLVALGLQFASKSDFAAIPILTEPQGFFLGQLHVSLAESHTETYSVQRSESLVFVLLKHP